MQTRTAKPPSPFSIANIRLFIAFRLLFNCRFYYPVFTILFLDYGLTLEQFALLNSVWAATIVIAEVPSGALADLIGRRSLLLTTATLMVVEMALLAFVPLGHVDLVFMAFLFNRICSGLAEAMASGADEALAYDSLLQEGDSEQWPRVLSVMMRIQAAGTVVTMAIGALIYDPEAINVIFQFFGATGSFQQSETMRFPVYLTLMLAICCLLCTFLMHDPAGRVAKKRTALWADMAAALRLTIEAGGWILRTPFALAVIIFAMGYDHILRMIITLNSKYFRLIELPEASYGVIGAGMALMGLVVPKVAEWMVRRFTPLQNMLWLTALTLTALGGLAAVIPYWGVLPMALVPAGLLLTAFFTSHYLNRITESHRRATVLSFKGLAFNFAYMVIGVAFAMLMDGLRRQAAAEPAALSPTIVENTAFAEALVWFIPYSVVFFLLAALYAVSLLRDTSMHRQKG